MGFDLWSRAHHENGVRLGYALTMRWQILDWPLLMDICREAGFDVPRSWYFNDWDGPETQAECDKLASLLEAFLAQDPDFDRWTQPADCDLLTLVDGIKVRRAQKGGISREDVPDFIDFLRRCGGFQIA